MEWSNEVRKIKYMLLPSIELFVKQTGQCPSLAMLNHVNPDGSFLFRNSNFRKYRGMICEDLLKAAINRGYVVMDMNYRLYITDSRLYENVLYMKHLNNKAKVNYQGL